jgi:HK97 family phage portal protein
MALLDAMLAPWLAPERRSYWLGPFGAGDKALSGIMGGKPTYAGVSVTEQTALTLAAVWAAVTMISGAVASLPLFFYRRIPGGKEQYVTHPLYHLLHAQPNPQMGTFTFREVITHHMLLWGNAYAEIQLDGGGRARALWPITPDRVTPYQDRTGALRYRITNGTQPDADLAPDHLLHFRGLGFDGVQGYSVIRVMARQSLGLTAAAEKYGAQFFGAGAHASFVAQHPGEMGQEQQKRFKDSVKEAVGGDNAFSIMVLEEGIKVEKITIPPDDAQFLETRRFQTEEIARWFNIPPHKIKDLERSTNNNIEQQSIEFVTDTLEPWLKRIEEELTLKLVRPLEKGLQKFEFQVKGRLRGDTAAQTAHYATMVTNGLYTLDEIRAFEGLNPLPDGLGARAFLQGAMVPLDRIDEIIDAQVRPREPAPTPAAPPPPQPAAPEDDAGRGDRVRAIVTAVVAEVVEALPAPQPALPPPPDPALGELREVLESVRGALEAGRVDTAAIARATVDALTPALETIRAAAPPAPDETEAIVARVAGAVSAEMASVRGDLAAAQDVTRRLHEWQHATVAMLVGRLVRREIAHARKLVAEPARADERIEAFRARFHGDAMEDLRPWLTRETGLSAAPIGDAIEAWAADARTECLAALTSGTLPDLVRRWENGRAEAKTADLMGVIYGPTAR